MILIDDHIQDYSPGQIARWLDELPEWRRKQALAYKHDAGRRQCLLAYRLLCQGLREKYGITILPTFRYGEHGKPYLERGPHFSLSHCRGAVCCAISDRPVGIDIEAPDRHITDSLVRYTMTEEEMCQILQSPRTAPPRAGDSPRMGLEEGRAFLRLWTRKEAVAKLLGTGISDDFKNILSQGDYHIETRTSDRWVMSVARHR